LLAAAGAALAAQDEHPQKRMLIALRPLKGPLRGPTARIPRLAGYALEDVESVCGACAVTSGGSAGIRLPG